MSTLSSRPLIVCLLPLAAFAAGCDRKSDAPAQAPGLANVVSTDEVAADEVKRAPVETADKLDRSHKGESAPALAFEAPDGKPVALVSFAGKPVLVNLWATWCGPCVAELPTLDALGKSGKVRVVAVAQDLDASKVATFLAKRGVTLDAYRDPKLGLSLAYQANLPTTILFDAGGREVWRMTGAYEWNTPAAAALIAEAEKGTPA
ncbi:TlpA family protein disulfide reductase [Sphingomonas sp.]|uniref:TlpA family protein disulfide reductase n=1 Tax=Sphingomonas sp. TaxID=28214 RepID=UPI0035BC061C